jgi:hypothetical protein
MVNKTTQIQKNGITITIAKELAENHWIFKSGGRGCGVINCFQTKQAADESRAFFLGKTMYNGTVKVHTYTDGSTFIQGVSKVRLGKRRKTDGYGYQGRHQASTSGYFTENAIGDKKLGFNVLCFFIRLEKPHYQKMQDALTFWIYDTYLR